MAEDLKQVHERLSFCRELIEETKAHLDDFVKKAVSEKFERNGPNIWAYARIEYDLPISTSTRAGLVVNEIRATLDALAWILATERNHTPPRRNIYFPIARDEEKLLAQFKKRGNLHKAFAKNDEDTIIGFAPYSGGNDTLFMMHEADNIRKHRKSLVVAVQGSISATGPGRVGLMMNNMDINAIANPGEWKPVGMFNNSTASMRVRSEIRYNEPGLLEQIEVVQALREFWSEALRIVSAFD